MKSRKRSALSNAEALRAKREAESFQIAAMAEVELELRALSKIAVQLLDLVRDRQRITISGAVKEISGSTPSLLRPHFERLLELGLLRADRVGRAVWYVMASL